MTKSKIIFFVLLFYLFPAVSHGQIKDKSWEPADTISYNPLKSHKIRQVASIAIPALMVTYGVISVKSDGLEALDHSTQYEIDEHDSYFYNRADDILQYSPGMAAFTLKLCGVESKSNLADMCAIYALSNLLDGAIVYTMKSTISRIRPDGSKANSFPSGHTSTAFVAAEFLSQEYGQKSIWISIGGYSMATLVGISRIYNNRHWVSDVITGAGIGILCTKGVYWVYPHLKKAFYSGDKKSQTLIFPGYSNGNLSLNISCTF